MAKPFVHPGMTTRLSSGVHTSAKLHSRSSCTSEVNGRYIRTPDSSWGHTMCHLTQFPVPGSGRRQMPRIQSNSRANWSLLWCAYCQRLLWPLTIHDSASPQAKGGFCLFNNCVLSPLSFHHPPHLCQAACLGITWRIATTSSFWPATSCPPLTLVHVSKQWANNPYLLSSCQSWFYRQVIWPLSAIPFPDQDVSMAVVCTPDCHRWFLASFSGRRGHQAVLGALACWWPRRRPAGVGQVVPSPRGPLHAAVGNQPWPVRPRPNPPQLPGLLRGRLPPQQPIRVAVLETRANPSAGGGCPSQWGMVETTGAGPGRGGSRMAARRGQLGAWGKPWREPAGRKPAEALRGEENQDAMSSQRRQAPDTWPPRGTGKSRSVRL